MDLACVNSGRAVFSFLLALGVGGLAGPPAEAQIDPLIPGKSAAEPNSAAPEQQSAAQRLSPAYNPIGAQVGDFLFYPTLDLQGFYNSNVFATETGQKSDLATFVDPNVSVLSNWNRNALNFNAGGDIRRYASLVSENQSNFHFATNGHYDIEQNVYLTGGLAYQELHEDRTSPNSVTNEKTPTLYQLVSGRLGYVHDAGIVGIDLYSGLDWYSYDNNSTSTGLSIPETNRNRVEYGLTPRVTYEIAPGYHAFIQAPLNLRVYQAKFDAPPSAGGFQRSSHGYEIDAGTAFQVTSLINGEVYVGYQEQDYDDSRLAPVSGPSFGGNILWNPTLLTSVRLNAARTVEETTVATAVTQASSFVQSQVGLSLEHDLLENLLLTAGVTYTDQNYQGIVRDDDVLGATLGARYLINEYLAATLTGTYGTRLSNAAPNACPAANVAPGVNVGGCSYHQETVLAGLRLQY